MSRKIGIDLGTTLTLASFINSAGKPELIPNSEGNFFTPSVVWVKDGCAEVGEAAFNRALEDPEFLAVQMKRNMGDDSYRFHGLSATDVAAHLLMKSKRDAESHFGEAVSGAAITVPAYFTDAPLKATKEAGRLAGLEVIALPKEPTAAALHYGTTQMKSGEKLLVCDLGGGTMDATVLEYTESPGKAEFAVLSSEGSRDLGGEDWTARLVGLVAPAFEDMFGFSSGSDRRIEQALFDSCERAKQALTTFETARVVLAYQGRALSVPVTRGEFEDATGDLLEQAMLKVEGALRAAGLASGGAGVLWCGLSRVLLVGGSTRMRMVARELKARTGLGPISWGVPDQLVALGAALYTAQRAASGGGIEIIGHRAAAAGGAGIVITLKECTSHGLGTVVVGKSGCRARLVSSVIIKPGTEIPAGNSRSDYRTRPHQTEVDVPVVQVDEDGLGFGSCILNKTYRFIGIPDRDVTSAIRVLFHYDKDNMVDVTAVDVATERTLEKMVIEFSLQDVGSEDLRVVLVLDTSSSMDGDPLAQLKGQVNEVCNELESRGCDTGVVEFGYHVRVVCLPTNDFRSVRYGVEQLEAGGSTPMAEGLASTLAAFKDIDGRRVAILVSDGCPDSQPDARREAGSLKEFGIKLYTISIGTAGADFLRSIGDSYTQIDSAGDLADAVGKLLWSS